MKSRHRLVRSPNIATFWRSEGFVLEEFAAHRRIIASPLAAALLDRFSRPSAPEKVAQTFPPFAPGSVRREIARLTKLGFLLPEETARARGDLGADWKELFPVAFFRYSARGATYIAGYKAQVKHLKARLKEERQPPLYKSYVRKKLIPLTLAPLPDVSPESTPLLQTLDRRRTVREFTREKVPFEKFSALIEGTFGQSGWIDASFLGRLILKRYPSGGARHPLECYILAWKVEGLAPGLYHYNVRRKGLELLKRGDLRREAVQLASGQRWVGHGAFLCVLSAVFARTLWKYPPTHAYRLLFLEAGHAAQNFALLATILALGPFQTAAMQESKIEKLIGLDGVNEFPVYLLGAGVPAGRQRFRQIPL